MNKSSEPKGNISKLIQEMIHTSANCSSGKRNHSPEKTLNPPKPISPPRIFSECEAGKIVSKSQIPEPLKPKSPKSLPIYSLFQSKTFKVSAVEPHLDNINSFAQGGSRALWLRSIRLLCKQSAIPLVKEIIYNRGKCLDAKALFKKKLKEYLAKKNKEKKGTMNRPPFISNSKVPLDSSKHISCKQAKEDSQKHEKSDLEEMKFKVLMELNRSNCELQRTVFLVFQLLTLLASTRVEFINEGLEKREFRIRGNMLKEWKEYSSKRVVKKEFYVLLGHSLENRVKARIFRAFREARTFRSRKAIRMDNYQATLQFKITKRLMGSWRKLTEIKHKFKTGSCSSKNTPQPNMFTLSVSNLKSADYYEEIIPETLLLKKSRLDKKKMNEMIAVVNDHYHKLKKIPIGFHIRKASSLTRDFKGTSEKLAERLDSLRIISMFYQNWKRKYCKKWLISLFLKVNSYTICKKAFSGLLDYKVKQENESILIISKYEKTLKKRVFKSFQKTKLLKQLVYKSSGILAQKYFHAWIKFIFYKASRLEKSYNSSIFYQKKLLSKSFNQLKRLQQLALASVIFRVNSLKRTMIKAWKGKLDSKNLLRKVFGFSLDLWKERIDSEFRSDSHMLAVIIKGWRTVCERKGNTKKQRIKLLMATNFNKSKRKITSFFRWKRFGQRRKSVKATEKAIEKIVIRKKYDCWQVLKINKRLNRNKFVCKRIFNAWKGLNAKKTTRKVVIKEQVKKPKREFQSKISQADRYHRALLMKKSLFSLIVTIT